MLSFRSAFLLALAATMIGGAIALDVIPRQPEVWGKLAALAMLTLTWVNTVLGNPLRPAATSARQPLPLPDARPGVAGGPLLALVCFGALFAGGCDWRPIENVPDLLLVGALVGCGAMLLCFAGIFAGEAKERRSWFSVGGFAVAVPVTLALAIGGCTAAERARVRDSLITTAIGTVNCASPGLQAGIQAAVVQLLGSAVSGRGAGTAEEWRALGLGLRDKYGFPAAACAAEVVAKELAKLALPPSPAIASGAPVVGFVQPQQSGTRAQASGGALGLEASAGGGSTGSGQAGSGQAGSITSAEDASVARALAAAQWLREHPGEW